MFPKPLSLNKRKKRRWVAVNQDLPYVFFNINWTDFFWKTTDNGKIMHILGVKKEDSTKKIAIFWVTGPIRFAVLEYGTYKSWNIKVDYKIDVVDKLRNYLKTKGIFG